MIIKKKNFNLTPRCRGKWPFTVPEVCVSAVWLDEQRVAFALVHEFRVYALSSVLCESGFMPSEESGIRNNAPLTELFAWLTRLLDGDRKLKTGAGDA